MALVLATVLFFLHAALLIEVADVLPAAGAWLRGHHSALGAGKILILCCFVVLFIAHFAEAAAWGFFFWRHGLAPSYSDGVYFAAVSVTSLGYGDLVLPTP
jgi:hypothetical protein